MRMHTRAHTVTIDNQSVLNGVLLYMTSVQDRVCIQVPSSRNP